MTNRDVVASCLVELIQTTASVVSGSSTPVKIEEEKVVEVLDDAEVVAEQIAEKEGGDKSLALGEAVDMLLEGGIDENAVEQDAPVKEDTAKSEVVEEMNFEKEPEVKDMVKDEPNVEDEPKVEIVEELEVEVEEEPKVEVEKDHKVMEEEKPNDEPQAMDEAEESFVEDVVDFSSYKVAQIKAELSKRGLDTKGLKAVLLKRLTDFISSSAKKRTIDEVDDCEEQPGAKKIEIDKEESEEEESEEEESEEKIDFSKLKVAELRNECSKLGLDTKGVKAVLVERLEKAAKGGDVEESEEEESDVSMEIDYSSMKVAQVSVSQSRNDELRDRVYF